MSTVLGGFMIAAVLTRTGADPMFDSRGMGELEGCDGIGTHEIGHSIIQQLGIDPQTKWFNEFLAGFAGYAYLKAKAPAQALSNEIFWTAGLDGSPHPFTRLGDFESKYEQLQQDYPGNYGWYQLALDQRVLAIYAQSGIGYLKAIKRAFAPGGPPLDSAQLLNKLDRISPGWKTWAAHLEAGDLRAAYSGYTTRRGLRRLLSGAWRRVVTDSRIRNANDTEFEGSSDPPFNIVDHRGIDPGRLCLHAVDRIKERPKHRHLPRYFRFDSRDSTECR